MQNAELMHYDGAEFVLLADLIPCKINKPETVKISGHSLNGKKSILKPVKTDNIDIASNIRKVTKYTALTTLNSLLLIIVITIVKRPIKIKVRLSLIHSILIRLMLSGLILPNPFTTLPVGNR
jgi:hypothetical protein